jgi:enoyl-CoA hydratase
MTFNRPEKYNALLPETVGLMTHMFSELASDEDLRVVVLTGAGRGFCAGVDLDALAAGADFRASAGGDISAMLRFPHPIIAAVNGVAVTGGLEIALACDLRIASSEARFADTHARVGLIPGWGLTARLPQSVGQGWARQMSFSGEFVDAATAERIGLVNEVVEPAQLMTRTLAIANGIAGADRSTVTTLKSIFNEMRDGVGADALRQESKHTPVAGPHVRDRRAFTDRTNNLRRQPKQGGRS